MAAFSEILPLFGVDAAKGFMMVPVGGFNLIYHFLGKGASFADSLGGLSIKDVTEEIRKAPDVSTISKNPKQPLFVDKDDMTAFFHAALQGLSTDPSQRLLAVTANSPGVHTVTVKASRRSESLDRMGARQKANDDNFLPVREVYRPVASARSNGKGCRSIQQGGKKN